MSDRRDSSPRRDFSRPFSPPRGPRVDYPHEDGHFFTSDKIRPVRERHRDRSRSRSPNGRRRGSERFDNCYRPAYYRDDSSPTRPPLPTDARRTYNMNSSGNSSPFSKPDRAPLPKSSNPSDLSKKPESENNKAASGALKGVTWQDRAMNAPASVPATKMSSKESAKKEAEAVQALGEIFADFIDRATTLSALKSQESLAKKRYEGRDVEFEKSKSHHEKFPSIKESQTSAKADAERDYKAIIEKVAEKKSSLNSLAIRAAEHVIPALLTRVRGNSTEQDLQQRVDNLEKTCQGFQKLVEDQRTLLEEYARQASQTAILPLATKHTALEKEFKGSQNRWIEEAKTFQVRFDTEGSKVKDALQKGKEAEHAIGTLRMDLSTAKGDAAKISEINTQLSLNQKAQAQSIIALTTRVKEIDNLQVELKSLKESSSTAMKNSETQLKTFSERLSKVDTLQATSISLVNHVTDLANDQKKFLESWGLLDNRVTEVAKRSDANAFEDRLRRLEKNPSREVKDPATTKELDGLKDRINQLEQTPPPQNPLPAKPNPKSLEKRVDVLEQRMAPVSASWENGIFSLKAADIDVIRNGIQAVSDQVKKVESRAAALEGNNARRDGEVLLRLNGLESDASKWRSADKDLVDVKKRVSGIEDHQRRPSSNSIPALLMSTSSSSSNVQPQLDGISSRIQSIEKQLDDSKESQQLFEETWAGIVNESITDESKRLQARIASLEGKSSELDNGLNEVKESRLEDKKVIVADVVAIFAKQPGLLPFPTIDQVNKALAPMSSLAPMNAQIQRLQETSDRTEAISLSLGNLQARVDNINTLDMANHILGKLYENHPELQYQKTEATMTGFMTDLKGIETRLEDLSKTMNTFQTAIQSLEANVQDKQTTETMTQQYVDLRKEVDLLTDDSAKFLTRVRDVEKTVEEATKGLADLKNENDKNKETIATQFATFQTGLEEQIEKIKEATLRSQLPKATSPVMPYTSSRSNQNGINRGPRPNFSTAANRQPSITSDKNKKRKLDNGTSAKTNGVRQNSSSGSPQAKKARRRIFGADDSEDDPDFDPEEIPEPTVSTDEDVKPPRKPPLVIDLIGDDE